MIPHPKTPLSPPLHPTHDAFRSCQGTLLQHHVLCDTCTLFSMKDMVWLRKSPKAQCNAISVLPYAHVQTAAEAKQVDTTRGVELGSPLPDRPLHRNPRESFAARDCSCDSPLKRCAQICPCPQKASNIFNSVSHLALGCRPRVTSIALSTRGLATDRTSPARRAAAGCPLRLRAGSHS